MARWILQAEATNQQTHIKMHKLKKLFLLSFGLKPLLLSCLVSNIELTSPLCSKMVSVATFHTASQGFKGMKIFLQLPYYLFINYKIPDLNSTIESYGLKKYLLLEKKMGLI